MVNQYGIDIKKVVRIIGIVLLVGLAVYILYKLSYYIAPFIIAFAISSLLEPIIRFLIRRTRVSRKAASLITLLLVIIPIGVVIALIITRLISEIRAISKILPEYLSTLYTKFDALIVKSTEFYNWLPKEITDSIDNIVSNFSNTLIGVLDSIVEGIVNTVISIPQALIFIVMTILSTYFLTSDRDRIYNYIKSQFPESWINKVTSIKNDMFSALFGYIRAQLILMSITFGELFIGFSIIGARYSLLLAFLTSIVDALPILGTGTILIPWGLYELFTGDIRMGVSLVIIYIIVVIVRQMIEPKILSHQIGVYPLVTLVAMYAGLKLFGVLGLILGPISILVLKNIIKGTLKNKPVKDFLNKLTSNTNNK